MSRLMTKSGRIPKEWQDTLDRFLGTSEWRSVFYTMQQTPDLFEAARQHRVRDASAAKLEDLILDRLRSIFPVVLNKGVALTNNKGQTMYVLCFVSGHPSPKVKELAMRLARWAAEV
jgi:hypothetical protein